MYDFLEKNLKEWFCSSSVPLLDILEEQNARALHCYPYGTRKQIKFKTEIESVKINFRDIRHKIKVKKK